MIQFVKQNYANEYLGKKRNKKKESLTVPVLFWNNQIMLRCPAKGGEVRGVMVKAMDLEIIVSEFVLQSRYNVHFRANTPG